MFKQFRSKLPDWKFIAYVVSNTIPGRKLLGDWRFPPIFFVAGCLFEVVLCKLRINNINFCKCSCFADETIESSLKHRSVRLVDDVYKRNQARHFVVKKHQLEDYLQTVTLQPPTPTH